MRARAPSSPCLTRFDSTTTGAPTRSRTRAATDDQPRRLARGHGDFSLDRLARSLTQQGCPGVECDEEKAGEQSPFIPHAEVKEEQGGGAETQDDDTGPPDEAAHLGRPGALARHAGGL